MNFAAEVTRNKVAEYTALIELREPLLKAVVASIPTEVQAFIDKNDLRFVDFFELNRRKWEVHSPKDLEYLMNKFAGSPVVVQERPDAMWLNGFCFYDGAKIEQEYCYVEDSHIVAGNLGKIADEPQITTCWPDRTNVFRGLFEKVVDLYHLNGERGPTYIFVKTARMGENYENAYLYEFGYEIPQILLSAKEALDTSEREDKFYGAACRVYDYSQTQYIFAAHGNEIFDTWRYLYSQIRQQDILMPFYRIDGHKKAAGCFHPLRAKHII